MTKILRLLWAHLVVMDRRWALSQLNPTHPDVPMLTLSKRRAQDILDSQ